MKKKILAAMLAAMAVGAMALTGCSFGGGDSTESSSTVENPPAVSSEDTSSEESSTPDNTIVEPVSFETKFAENPIDAAYAIESPQALTNLDMSNLEDKYANLWKAEVDHAYQQLIQLGAEGAEADQQNWNSTVSSELQLLKDSITVTGSLASVEYGVKVKNFYREKAEALYEQLYALNPDYTYIYAAY